MKINTGCSFIHPISGNMIHPGQMYDDQVYTNVDIEKTTEQETEITDSMEDNHLTLEQFERLDANHQKELLIQLKIVAASDSDSVSNKEKRVELYKQFVEANALDGVGSEITL
ncbi:hypothetical protein [Brevibacillus laterosporus]|uniref:hypothetical protein n=1 Tax=Brevibacillus laterosporus TaxID=1465 RepID=UPI002E24B862|nr:hypothetical protein [Brevibacillus laterosporus]MED1670417.1 hypothetical protein [Brevibacillus laterosporus]MED1720705.1 hypothetical protein [Brevibacillus laterosporus]